MIGKFLFESPMGGIVFDISGATPSFEITLEVVQLGMKLPTENVVASGNKITLDIIIPMLAGAKNSFNLDYNETEQFYTIKGSFPMAGEISGPAYKTEIESAEKQLKKILPTKKTGKIVRRTNAEIEKAVDELLAKMTLSEKIGQMHQIGGIGNNKDGEMSTEDKIKAGLIGSVIAMASPAIIFEQQRIAVEESRLGIPLLFCQDVIHGQQTIFPIPLASACSFNPALVKESARVAASEATSNGIALTFSPMVDIARDPRWGRISEGSGEDPHLVSLMSKAQVSGYQGDDLTSEDSILACLKHFIGYGAAEGGRDYNTCEISDTTLRNIYARPFKAGINAGAASVMASFNTINSVPVTASKKMMRGLLRDELGFEGMTISDHSAFNELINHGIADGSAQVAKLCIESGMDLEMATENYITSLETLVEDGAVSASLVDQAVRRLLTYKYKTGLMDSPYKNIRPEAWDKIFSDEYLDVSRRLAEESIVVLKNDGLLPLDKNKKIALIGPFGNSKDLLGTWQFSQYAGKTPTILGELAIAGFDVTFTQGSDVLTSIDGGIEKAVAAAQNSDIVVLALGEGSSMSGEAASRQNITLPDAQKALAKAVKNCGKPVVLLLTTGRPLELAWFSQNTDAIVISWFLGSMAGTAIANVLSGAVNPSGKLSVSMPMHHGQIPVYYNHLPTGRPMDKDPNNKFVSKYLDGPNLPLYPFGFGLGYTAFDIGKLKLSSSTMQAGGTITATASITNTGNLSGTEVVQLYIRDVTASISRPVKELKAFEKIALAPGERQTVKFVINTEMLSFYNEENTFIAEPGKFDVMVGNSSADTALVKDSFTLI